MHSNIKRDYIWNTVGIFAQNAVSPLLLVVVTRINGIYDSGLFSFTFSIAMIFWTLAMWGGRTYQVSDVSKVFSPVSYITLRIILGIVVMAGAIVFVLLNNYDPMKSIILLTLVTLKVTESIADSLYGIMQTNGQLFLSGKSLLYKAVFGFLIFIIIDILTNNIFLSCCGLLAVNILIILFYDLPISSKLEGLRKRMNKYSFSELKQAFKIMKICLPVFIVMFLAMFSLNIPRYFIDIYHTSEIAYFGIIAMPITLIVILMSFILQPNVVALSKSYKNRDYTTFQKMTKKIFVVTIFVGCVTILGTATVGAWLLELIFRVDFSSHWLALVVIVAGGAISALVSVLINLLIIMRKVKMQFYVLLITNVLLIFASASTIPTYGLLGGVVLFVMINIIQLLLLGIIYSTSLAGVNNAKKN